MPGIRVSGLPWRTAQLACSHARNRGILGRDTDQVSYFPRSVTLDLTSVTLLGQYDTWSVSRPNLPPFRACEHASSAVLHGSPETLITGNSHACPKCEPTRARPNCLHGPPSMPQRSASRDALFVNEAQLASRICQQTALTGGPTLPIWAGWRDQKNRVHI